MELLLGIDLGSTSLKAVIYDLDGNVVARAGRPTELHHPSSEHPEWAVWLPEQIWGGTAEAVREAVAQLDDPGRIKAVAVTGMGMDGVPVDADGQWLYPFISWHDPRTAPQLKWWQENITAEKVFSIGGNPLWAINSALRILWVRENEPDIYARTDKWLLIEDFLNFMLCGRRVTDYSMASCTLLFDQRKLDWSDELLELSGIPRAMMPEVLPSTTPIGEIHGQAAEATGLPEGTPVILGGHDHLCGMLPVGAFRPGAVLDVTGTWESVLAATSGPMLEPALRTMGITVQAHVAPGLHTIWGGNPAGGMLEWYRKEFGLGAAQKAEKEGGTDWDYLTADAVASPPGANRVMFLPHMSSASCPVVDEKAKGAFVGLTSLATGGDMLRAIIEGLSYQLRDVVTAMQHCMEDKLERIITVGGAVRNKFWMQNKADVLGRPIDVPEVEEATPLGAAILAGIGAGLYTDIDDAFARVYRPGTTYEPDPELAARYAEWFEIYRRIYPALKPVHNRMA